MPFILGCVIKIDIWIILVRGCFLRNLFALGKEIEQKTVVASVPLDGGGSIKTLLCCPFSRKKMIIKIIMPSRQSCAE